MSGQGVDQDVEPTALSLLTSPEAARRTNERRTAAIVPTGAVEQHGPHLPLNTDLLIAEAVAKEVAGSAEGVTAEPLAYGCSWHHTSFGGTVSVRTTTFISLVFDVCRSLSDSGFVPVLLNGHHGNKAPLQVALADLAETGVRGTRVRDGDLHDLAPAAGVGEARGCAPRRHSADMAGPTHVRWG
jgi:creatinine amidohydrolase